MYLHFVTTYILLESVIYSFLCLIQPNCGQKPCGDILQISTPYTNGNMILILIHARLSIRFSTFCKLHNTHSLPVGDLIPC